MEACRISSRAYGACLKFVVVFQGRRFTESEPSALHWIAEDQHFFSRNDLNVAFHELGKGLASLEDEARWMIRNNLTSEKQIPDFVNYIYTDGLKAIKPEAVNIIR
jgi:hypothetical protein